MNKKPSFVFVGMQKKLLDFCLLTLCEGLPWPYIWHLEIPQDIKTQSHVVFVNVVLLLRYIFYFITLTTENYCMMSKLFV
jgi:hypothetical protein